ncbi:MAG: glycosyltransferase family 2 protein, partial [Acidobacteria bacterium]|nr:glycosyltransferase family 2 protein [Acidobacteriota bacterium]
MTVLFLIFAAILVWFSFKSLLGGISYLSFFKLELAKPLSQWTPMVTVICPCRGVDEGMEENLLAITRQDYPLSEVVFVVDDKNDVAVEIINTVISRREAETERESIGLDRSSAPLPLCGSSLVVASKATGSAQKVENLREAVGYADASSEVFVFVDSDTRVSPTWLSYLIAPLEDDRVGAATGYRWFISETRSFASEMRSVWNASIASALGPNTKSNFCWGGSTAIRR